MPKTIKVIDNATGELLAEVEERKLGAWFAKNRMGVVQWFKDSVTVKPV